jgi:DNA mismatch repair protein MutL
LYEGFEKGDISTDLTDLTGLTGLTGLTASEVESTSQVPLFEESKSEANSLCFQYHNRYIITCLKSGLAIIDRHRAHIRILYERLIKDVIMQRSVSQRLIFPQIIELTASEASLLQTHNEEIRFLGFEIEYMGGNSYAINGTPSDMSGGDPCSLIKDMLAAVAEGVSGVNRRAEAMTLSLARAMAVRAGKSMSHEEAETLIAQLFALENNGLTPDGLPIITIITDTELQERMKG